MFGETEVEPALGDTTDTQSVEADVARLISLRNEIAELTEQLRRRRVRFPTDPPPPPFVPGGFDLDDSDDSPPAPTLEMSQQGPSVGISSSPFLKGSPEPRRSHRTKSTHATVSAPARRRAKDRWFFEPVPPANSILDGELSLPNREVFLAQRSPDAVSISNPDSILGGELSLSNQGRYLPPKSSDAVSLSDRGVFLAQKSFDDVSPSNPGVRCARISPDAVSLSDPRIVLPPSHLRRENGEKYGETMSLLTHEGKNGETMSLLTHEGKNGETIIEAKNGETIDDTHPCSSGLTIAESVPALCPRSVFLTPKVLRRILLAKESLFKFGTFVPRNETEALRSPGRHRWIAGRDLEWLRMGNRGTFERDWTWNRMMREFPHYLKSDIGFLFYVFDYKFSGEHRVRLVFDGSRQSPTTYNETYAPAARQESVRLFHIVLVEE